MPEDQRVLITGNHERLLKKVILSNSASITDHYNGTINTCYNLANIKNDSKLPQNEVIYLASKNKDIWKYLDSTINYFEIKNYIFVHGWIPCYYQECCGEFYNFSYMSDWRNTTDYHWNKATWVNGMEAWDNGIIEPNKTIICGHWMSNFGNNKFHNTPDFDSIELDYKLNKITEIEYKQLIKDISITFKDNGIYCLDATTAYTGHVNCEVIEIED